MTTASLPGQPPPAVVSSAVHNNELAAEPDPNAIIKPVEAAPDQREQILRELREDTLAMMEERSRNIRLRLSSVASMMVPVLRITSPRVLWGLIPLGLISVSCWPSLLQVGTCFRVRHKLARQATDVSDVPVVPYECHVWAWHVSSQH